MPTQIQLRRGSTVQTSTFTGAAGEITVDTDKKIVVVHDGASAGGIPLARGNHAQAAFDAANTTVTGATSAGSYANSAFNTANNKLSTTGGTISGNMVITGNLTVSGNVFNVDATNLNVEDNMIYLNANNTVLNPDLGFAANYNDGAYHHTGMFRDATDGTWKFFYNYDPEPDASPYIDTGHATFRIANLTANLITDVATIRGYDPINHTNAAYSHANAAFTAANNSTDSWVRDAANSASAYANAGFGAANSASSYANGAFTQANSAFNNGTSASSYANGAFSAANAASSYANSAFAAANSSSGSVTSVAAGTGLATGPGTTVTGGTALVVNGVNTNYTSVTNLSATKAIATYQGTTGYLNAVILNISGATITSGTVLEVNAVTSIYTSVAVLSATQAIVTYRGASNYLQTCTLNISGSTITAGAILTVNAVTSNEISVTALSTTQALVSYTDATTGYLKAVTLNISGTTVTAGTVLAVNAENSGASSVATLSATQAIATYTGNSGYLRAVVLNISGTTVTAGTVLSFPTLLANSMLGRSVTALSETQAIVTCTNGSTSNYVNAVTLNISGSTITAGTIFAVNNVAGCEDTTITRISSTQALVAYSGVNDYLQTVVLSVSGTTITAGTILTANAVVSYKNAITILSATQALVLYSGTSSYLNAILLTIPAVPITTSGTVSLANTDVTAGSYTTADITVDAQGRITAAANGSSAPGSYANSAYLTANSASSYANGAFLAANTADQRAVTSGSYANSAYAKANTGGGSGLFNSSINVATGYAITSSLANAVVFSANATIYSIYVTNIGADVNAAVTVTADFTPTGSSANVSLFRNIPIPSRSSVEMLKKPQVVKSNDIIKMQSFVNGTAASSNAHVTIVYETTTLSSFDRASALANTGYSTLYTATDSPAVIESIKVVNQDTAFGNHAISIIWTNSGNTIQGYIAKDIILPANSTIELSEAPKYLYSGDKLDIYSSYANVVSVFASAKRTA